MAINSCAFPLNLAVIERFVRKEVVAYVGLGTCVVIVAEMSILKIGI